MRLLRRRFLFTLLLLFQSHCLGSDFPLEQWKNWSQHSDDRYPGQSWLQYAAPEEAGWSSEKLRQAHSYYESLDAAAAMVIHDGIVLVAWGEVDRRFPCHSIRKSLLSALLGVHVSKGDIDLNKTLSELQIDDDPPLTDAEKSACVADLLKSRSAIYHPAAYETKKMKDTRPPRGSHRPGECFWYNNWDFNALCTIFEQETDRKVFETFASEFAEPLGMEDFRLQDTYYHVETEHSRHPAYPFRMSARDLARFGLLMLRQGRWRDQQILTQQWVCDSTRSYFNDQDVTGNPQYGYGYLWWPIVDGPFQELGMFSARGFGGHAVDVVPLANLVLAFRVDTYWDLDVPLGRDKKRVETSERFKLLSLILDARVDAPKSDPRVLPMRKPRPRVDAVTLSPETLEKCVGEYEFDDFALTVTGAAGGLLIGTPRIGQFSLLPKSETEFDVEDLHVAVTFELDSEGAPFRIIGDFAPGKTLEGRRLQLAK